MSIRKLRSHWWIWTAIRCSAVVALSFSIAYLLRFDFVIPNSERKLFLAGLIITVVVKTLLCMANGLEMERLWRYQGFSDLSRLLATNLGASVLSCGAIFLVLGAEFPRSVYCLDLLVCILLTGGCPIRGAVLSRTPAPVGQAGRRSGF